jgi:hypothetical protein
MLKILRQNLKNWAILYSSRVKYSTKRYLSLLRHKLQLGILLLDDRFDLRGNLYKGIGLLINILITGYTLNYIINNRNPFSYGLCAFTITYYISWLIREIKGKK